MQQFFSLCKVKRLDSLHRFSLAVLHGNTERYGKKKYGKSLCLRSYAVTNLYQFISSSNSHFELKVVNSQENTSGRNLKYIK